MTIKIAKLIYRTYHILSPSAVRTCRFDPTCSQYALEAIEKYGALKGGWLAIKRLLSCHPFSNRPYYDPIQ